MLFNSYIFVLFLSVTFALFYAPMLARFQNAVLIAASLVFYGYAEPALLLLLILSITVNFVCSYRAHTAPRLPAKRAWAAAGVIVNLAILGFFKYSPLAVRLLRLETTEGSIGSFLLHIPLPVGISFFTFQGISLMVDVFRQERAGAGAVEIGGFREYLVKTTLFKAFFPQLVAGPIVKAHDFYPQIVTKRLGEIRWDAAFKAVVLGYFMKMVIADNLKDITYWLAYPQFLGFPTLTLLSLLFGYSIQIFADFAGYSLIAIGIARLFGYELMENFNFPYISRSLSEFWRRWHISLSTWLKEYLYIPLGGNRKGEARTYLNLIVVMLLGGLWHGAAVSYAVWGLFHGVGLAAERLLEKWLPKGLSVLRILLVFTFVSFGWLLFKLPNFGNVIAYFKALGTNTHLKNDPVMLAYIALYALPVIAWHAHAWWKLKKSAWKAPTLAVEMGYAACVFAILLNSGSAGAFIYFQF